MAAQFPEIEVGVAIIRHQGKVLLVYNPRWGAFTLPMSKRHERADPRLPDGRHVESYQSAAARAAAEVLGRTVPAFPSEPAFVLPKFDQSDSDGQWKRYCFQAFELELPADFDPQRPGSLAPGAVVEFLTDVEVGDMSRMPISDTARDLIAQLHNPDRRRPARR